MKTLILGAALALGLPLCAQAQNEPALAPAPEETPAVQQQRPTPPAQDDQSTEARRPAEQDPAAARGRLSDNPATNPIVRQGNLFTNRAGVAPEGTTEWYNPADRGSYSRDAAEDVAPGRQNLPGVTDSEERRPGTNR